METNVKTLIKNSGILAISNASLKVISFLLLPLYTSVLPPEAYGISDTIINASTLMASIFSLCLDWGMNTYFYEENSESYYKKVTSSGLLFFSTSAMVCMLFVVFSKEASMILFRKVDHQYAIVIGIMLASVHLLYFPQRVSTRMRGRFKIVGIISIIELSVTLTCNILFILVFHFGYISIVLSNLAGQTVAMILYTTDAYRYLSIKSIDTHLLKKMLIYSIPITPTLLFDWINAFLDRYFVGLYFSQTEVGLYGMGTRMVSMLSIFTSSFLSAYSSFAYSNAKDEKNREKYSLVFDLLIMILSFAAASATLFSKEIVQLMTAQAYHSSYKVVGILLFAHSIHVVGLVAGYGITIRKKGGLYLKISGTGALANIIMNFLLVPKYSFLGAAIATLITESIIFMISYYYSGKLFDCGYDLKKLLICFIVLLSVSYLSMDMLIGIKVLICIILFFFEMNIYKNRIRYLKSILFGIINIKSEE